jgi:photosystem II stability/assembly factor-like uncharacterized protein
MIAVGENCTIIRSDDNGNSWVNLSLAQEADLYSVHFVDATNGWIAGEKLLHTTDGGNSFTELPFPFKETMRAIYFINTQTGFSLTSLNMYKTVDGGQNWSLLLNCGTGNEFFNFSIVDENNCWVSSRLQLYHTTDGGQNWNIANLQYPSYYNFKIYFSDNETGWILKLSGNDSRVLATRDGGNSWYEQYIPTQNNFPLRTLYFLDNSFGLVSDMESVYCTHDGGENWAAFKLPNFAYAVHFAKNGSGMLVGSYGNIVRSSDYGKTWKQIDKNIDIISNSCFFIDPLHGWLAGLGSIARTTNGGLTWEKVFDKDNSFQYNKISFVTPEKGWSLENNSVTTSIDSGKTWAVLNALQSYSGRISDIQFIDENQGIAVGGSGLILKTLDGGKTWSDRSVDTQHFFLDIFFLDKQYGWTVGGQEFEWVANAGLARTADGGNTWEFIQGPWGTKLDAVQFLDKSIGYACGSQYDNSSVYKTSDGGNTWVCVLDIDIAMSTLTDLYFFDEQFGWVIGGQGSTGVIYSTHDGGVTWKKRFQGGHELAALSHVDTENIWACGGSTLLHCTEPLNTSIINHRRGNEKAVQPVNYPNPFNSQTEFRFRFASSGEIKLAIYDLNGRLVETLYDGYISNGEHHFIWDAGNNPTGLYFYRLEKAHNKQETGRCVLIK